MDIATRLRAKLKLDSDESLVDMFDDILLAFNSRLQDSAYLEEQMLQMAVHFEKTRKRYGPYRMVAFLLVTNPSLLIETILLMF